MSTSKMVIPKTITVGFQKREDTYTGKLGYVIYTDNKGVLRKEASWQSWRDSKIKSLEFKNVPTSGFVLNKKAGGYKSGWDVRRTVVRVYDPRDFEFEVSVPTLLFILQETSSLKGKGLDGEFVYAWNGTELVLLPTCSDEYRECVKFTNYQAVKISKDTMIEGHTYLMKDMKPVMYLGRHDFCEAEGWREETAYRPLGSRHVFLNLDIKNKGGNTYIAQTGFTKIAEKTSSDVSPLFADAYDKFKRSPYCNKVLEVKLVPFLISKSQLNYSRVAILKEGEKFYTVRIQQRYSHYEGAYEMAKGSEFKPVLKDGTCVLPKLPYRTTRYDTSMRFTERELLAKEFYTAILVTKKGDGYDLTKNVY